MKKVLYFLLILILVIEINGQQIITPDTYSSYKQDYESLAGLDTISLMYHEAIREKTDKPFRWVGFQSKIGVNTGYARGYNDGAVWKGKGLNYELHSGVSGSFGILSYTFQPVIFYSQNASFDLADRGVLNTYAYQFSRNGSIDWVQRYGNDALWKVHPGQSEIKLTKYGLKLALSTQNFSYGPAIFSPIVMSNNAPGFPKIYLGTDGAQKIGYKGFQPGKVELNILYGLLRESDYFNENDNDDWRYLNALFVAYSPSFLPNLSIGFNKMLYKQTRYLEPTDWYSTIVIKEHQVKIIDGDTINSGNDFFDQLASLSIDWKFPSVGFRAYGEYARNDFNGDLRRLLVEPEHSRSYLLGFQKLFELGKSEIILSYEHSNLSRNHTLYFRVNPPYYEHGINKQGYTHQGQILGSGIGPGGNMDFLEVKVRRSDISLLYGLMFQRIEFNKDYFVANLDDFDLHDTEYSLGASIYKGWKDWIVGLNCTYSYNFNRYYIENNDLENWNFSLSIGTAVGR